MQNNVLVIGGGGREHAIVATLLKSPKVKEVYIVSGNGGTGGIEGRTFNVSEIKENEHQKILHLIKEKDIELVIVGPETPLSEGIINFLEEAGIKVFGPRKEAANLEASKIFMKDVLIKAGIPTAKYKAFNSSELNEALKFLNEFKGKSIVIKADGLAAGKGVVIASSLTEAKKEVTDFLNGKFGTSSTKIVIEEFLDGIEASLFAITDGNDVICFGSACDYKKIKECDIGLNTGGMGTFSPSFLTAKEEKQYTKDLITPVVKELKKRGITYKGVLFAGLMVCEGEAKVLEFNCRFGDPETQSILPRLESDFYEICLAVAEGNLKGVKAIFSKTTAVSVVVASNGYPESGGKGDIITLPEPGRNEFIFHAGTALKSGILTTNGGRVLAVTAISKTKKTARKEAYSLLKGVHFNGMQFRNDIAEDLISLQITIEDERWKEVGIGFYDFFNRLAKLTFKAHFSKNPSFISDAEKLYEVSILLTCNKLMQETNKMHRGKDTPTNVLSFPLKEEYKKGIVLMGDVIIALETIQREAIEQGKSFKEHLAHLFVHSVLHLIGYDHEIPKEMVIMEALEDEILNSIDTL